MSDDEGEEETFHVKFSSDSNSRSKRLRFLPRRKRDNEMEPFLARISSETVDLNDSEDRELQEVASGHGQSYNLSDAVEWIRFGPFQASLIAIVGFFVIADALEMMLLSILAPTIRCTWHLNSLEEAFITTVVFVGMMLGSSFWGWIADVMGRKTAVVVSASWIFYFGLLSAFSPHYYWIIALRCLVGFGIGGAPQATTLLSEFLPSKSRALCILSLAIFWAVGSTFTVAVAMAVMPTLGWRWLLAILCLPLLLFLAMSKWLPESCRFLLAAGERDGAIQVLRDMCEMNKKQMPQGELKDASQNAKRGQVADLFLKDQWKTTILLWIIWFNLAFAYYGIVLTTTELFQTISTEGKCASSGKHSSKADCGCQLLGVEDYVDMMWTTLAEFPGVIITMFIIDKLGRKYTAALEFVITAVFFFLLIICTDRLTMTIFIFIVRGAISGAFQTFYVYTPEVYPTVTRALGLGCCSGIARVGAMITPFVAQVLLKESVALSMGVYGGMSVICIIASLMLPIETKGREMQES
ncbi:synaptic vesicle 2-related protein isoform X2 [Nematostella vectensis]|uniref:synaptic vesicle 2-related protein isoform X2 n=1 Tax=Nematostella vectensis TaxID=45351 RepID=UPI002076FB98|nr:synaptic vesicle 2-related protein isoform X2 [Nematostella vectensis]